MHDHVQAFLEGQNVLLSGGKDGYLRAWDLATQHCFQTVTGLQGEVEHTATCWSVLARHSVCGAPLLLYW